MYRSSDVMVYEPRKTQELMYAVSLNIQLTFTSKVSFAFAVTFDAMTVVGGAGGVKVQDMPALNHMTLCLWTKFPQTSVSGLKMTILASYFDTSRKIGFSFNIVEYNSEGLIRFFLGHVDK